MKTLYELLAKVGTNPQLRAWAMKQLIKLKHLKRGYKDSFFHKMDKDKVKDIVDPYARTKQFLKDQNFNLKTKVVPIDQGRRTISIRKSGKQSDKDKFYGVTGQVTTAVNRIKKDIDDFWKKHALEDKWFDKTMKKHLKGDKKATKALDQDRAIYEYEKWLKEKDKVVPFKPKKAEGGRIGFKKGTKKGGIGDLMGELYRLFNIGPLLGSPELVDLIQKIPFEKGGRAGFDDGGSTQKEIDKALESIEKLKPSLMPESYEALIEIYKDKQKKLKIDIMESAGGLGDLLGEGGRAGFKKGSTRRRLQKDYESYAKFSDFLKTAPPNFWLFPEKYGIIRDDAMTYLKERFMYGDLDKVSSPAEIFKNSPELVKFKKWWAEREDKASGGRAGFDSGGSSIRKYEIPPKALPLIQEMYEKAGGRGQTGLSLKEFAFRYFGNKKGGRIGMENGGMPKWLLKILEELKTVKTYTKDQKKIIRDLAYPGVDAFTKAEGGRIGMQDGTPPTLGSLIIDFIVKYGRQPKPSEELQLKEKLKAKAKGGRIGFANGTTMDAFDSMTPNRRYMMTGESDVHRIMPPMGGILPMAGIAAILALRQKDKDKKKPITKKTKESKLPKKEPPKGEGILSEIVATKLLEDLVDVEEEEFNPKTGKTTTTSKTYKRSDKTRPPTKEELEDDYGELWSDEQSPLDFGSTIEELDAALEEQRSYERYWADQYKTGKLDDVMSMDAKIERVRSADDAGRPSGYSYDEEEEIREAADLKERIAVEKYEDAIKLDKAKESPWFRDPKKKAAGGRIGLQEGGPTYEDFEEFMEDRKKRDREGQKYDLLDDWKKWQRWKKHRDPRAIQEAKDGGIARRPNAVPPLSGPTPQGLTFLLGDDIVKNRIT